MRKYAILAAIAAFIGILGGIAQAGSNCQTTCQYNQVTKQNVCNTHCY